MNHFEQNLAKRWGKKVWHKLQNTVVGIAGAGGLGSNCALCLVRSGIRRFVIIDFDRIDYSNLNRQFYFYDQVGQPKVEALKKNLLAIQPNLEIKTYQEKLETANLSQYFSQCDVIVEAFDVAENKQMILEEYAFSDKLVVVASGLGGYGKADQIITRQIAPKTFLVGDGVSGVSAEVHPFAPHVLVTAAKQADIVLSYLAKQDG